MVDSQSLESKTVSAIRPWKVSAVLWLGTCGSSDGLRTALERNGCVIGGGASQILAGIPVSQCEKRIKIVVTTPDELGFKFGGRLGDVFPRGLEYGLELCPPEVGPQICIQCKLDTLGESVLIAMKPLQAKSSILSIFRVTHFHGAPTLRSSFGAEGLFCNKDDLLVFALPGEVKGN